MRTLILALMFLVQSFPAPGPGVHGTAGGGGTIAHVKSQGGFCISGSSTGLGGACATPTQSNTFSYTASTTGDGLLFQISCAASTTVSATSMSATGWTFTQIGSINGTTTTGFGALFRAYAPNTSAATVTFSFTATTGGCGAFMNVLVDEFSGMNATNFVDVSTPGTGTTGICSYSVTPTVNNDALWGGCNGAVTAVGAGFTKGADDTGGDWSEYKLLSGGSGSAQTVPFTGTSGPWEGFAVALK